MAKISTPEEARAWFENYGKADFGEYWPKVKALCINEEGWPFGIMHVGHFDKLELPYLSAEVSDELAVSYVYLATAFFCIDHLYDKESRDHFEILAQSLCLERGAARLSIALQVAGIDPHLGHTELAVLLQKFSQAMILEREIKAQPDIKEEVVERAHTIGRSWLVIFAYRVVQLIKHKPVSSDAQALLEEGIYLLQLGDDWGDWREDYKAGNWNTFLRRCFGEIGRMPIDENELERFVYLSGAYERQGRLISDGLRRVAAGLGKIYGDRGRGFNAVIDICRARADAVVDNFERVKSGLSPLPIPGSAQ